MLGDCGARLADHGPYAYIQHSGSQIYTVWLVAGHPGSGALGNLIVAMAAEVYLY
jgi:hypothetical protein